MIKDRKNVIELSNDFNKNKGADIIEVAQYFTELGSMKVRKLQILCFYAQAWYLVHNGARFIDSDFQAWAHGPTSKKLHDYYEEWGQLEMPRMNFEHFLTLTDYQKAWIHVIYDTYKDYSAKALETLSKSEEPYIIARNGLPDGEPCWNVIRDELMARYYKTLLGLKEEPGKMGRILEFPTKKK